MKLDQCNFEVQMICALLKMRLIQRTGTDLIEWSSQLDSQLTVDDRRLSPSVCLHLYRRQNL